MMGSKGQSHGFTPATVVGMSNNACYFWVISGKEAVIISAEPQWL